MSLGHTGVRIVAPTVFALLVAGAPTAASGEGSPGTTRTSVPELMLQAQYTFTGEVRDILVVDDAVWAASGGGLAIHRRADGAHLETLTSADGLPGNSLRSLLRVDEAHVMVGSDFGAALVDVKKAGARTGQAIVKLGCEHGCMQFDPVYAMASAAGGVWMLRHQSGVERWARGKDGTWVRNVEGKRGPNAWRALTAVPTPVLGGLDGRLVFQGGAGKAGASFVLTAPILALQARPNDVVVATGEKLLQARPDGVSTFIVQEAGTSRSLAASALSAPGADGKIWVGTARGEIMALAKDAVVRVVDGLPARVTAVAGDGERLWFGLGRLGLHVMAPGAPAQALRPANEICDNHVIAVHNFHGRTVAATFDQGACFLDRGDWHPIEGLASPMVHGMGSDGQELYLATSNGISRFDRHMRPRPIGRGDPAVLRWASGSAATAIAQIDDHSLAITSAYGLVQVRRNGKSLSATFTSHRAGVPLKLTGVASAGGEIWLASETQGAKSMGLAGQSARHLQDPDDLPENWVTALAAVGADQIWVGTCQQGVSRIRGNDRQFIDRRNLLPDTMVVALAADTHGAFIGTLGGLTFAAAEGLVGRSYGWETGLPDPRSSALLLSGSELWLGTEAGLAQFHLR